MKYTFVPRCNVSARCCHRNGESKIEPIDHISGPTSLTIRSHLETEVSRSDCRLGERSKRGEGLFLLPLSHCLLLTDSDAGPVQYPFTDRLYHQDRQHQGVRWLFSSYS